MISKGECLTRRARRSVVDGDLRTVDEHSLSSLETSLGSQSFVSCSSSERDTSGLFKRKSRRFVNEVLVLFGSERGENEISFSRFVRVPVVHRMSFVGDIASHRKAGARRRGKRRTLTTAYWQREPRPVLNPRSAGMIPKTRSPFLNLVESLASTMVPERSDSGTAGGKEVKEEGAR